MKAYYEDREKVSINKSFLAKFPLEAIIKEDMTFRAHWHHEIELVLVCQGRVLMGINSTSQVLKAGDIAFSNSGDIHYYESLNTHSKLLLIMFNPSLIGNLINLSYCNFTNPFICKDTFDKFVPVKMQDRIKTCYHEILEETINKDVNYDILIKSHLFELIGLLLRYIPHTTYNFKKQNSGIKCKEFVQSAINYIEENYNENISLERLSETLGISEFYFSKIFNHLTGQSFKTYLNNIRLEKAHEMIISTNKTITEIAFECGFNSLRTFNRVYKNVKGSIPSDSR